jgi:hypothetical protein
MNCTMMHGSTNIKMSIPSVYLILKQYINTMVTTVSLQLSTVINCVSALSIHGNLFSCLGVQIVDYKVVSVFTRICSASAPNDWR